MQKSPALVSGKVEGSGSVARWTWVRALAAGACAAALAGCTPTGGVADPVNELPFGNVDAPSQGAQVKALTGVAGWALDDRGIREIRLYIDGHLANTSKLTQPRPDVSQTFPQYARGRHRHGFTMLAGFDVPGPHTLVVQAVDTDGATRDIGVINVTAIDK
jgi:Bacterial Ig domain